MLNPLDPGQQIEPEQPGDPEPDLGLAVGIDVVALDLHRRPVPHRAIVATSEAEQLITWEWVAIDLRSTCR